ncbi:MAG TPA: DUF4168 domain-containing protein [Steroidobacter sp.]|jgi:hypothetical protein|nr:DUF4168 domain-containing protein [Steroidobacteraceae bacterium]HLS82647.1 DUF4168 domain-containing protein [Steroidobacter sp.]
MRFTHRTVIVGAAALGWLAAPIWAQEAEPPPAQQQSESESANDALGEPAPATAPAQTAGQAIDDGTLDQFADAYMEVQSIQQKAAADMESTENPTDAEKVRATAESDMIAAVERNGLQVDEFNRIVETMASDVEVRNRVAAKLQERSGGG